MNTIGMFRHGFSDYNGTWIILYHYKSKSIILLPESNKLITYDYGDVLDFIYEKVWVECA